MTLKAEEKEMLESLPRKGKSAARGQTRARILLKAAVGEKDKEIMKALSVSAATVYRTRQKCVEQGLEHFNSPVVFRCVRGLSRSRLAPADRQASMAARFARARRFTRKRYASLFGGPRTEDRRQ
ncbi:MAG: helix-turn-helix domain-containing protein [Zoogloeaceae bacterium]|nr:helix-turn-helix domain-containing protein [Zoogloeaceae bacterium]